uniref:Rubredoxin-like domain-containing protein n=1 Tax=Chenopodium quinoa TaxID=63459 RepID=A0A803KPL2_CHEQI
MASSITRPTTFSFHHTSPSPPKPKTQFISSTIYSMNYKGLTLEANHSNRAGFASKSIDVSKEDKPISEQPNSEEPSSLDTENLDKRRLEEKFAVLNTGIYECRSCGYRYDESAGDPSYPVPPGLPFGQLPEDWRCPTCGAAKGFFESKSVEIAGFAENQQFGLGGNSLTSGQKALIIYGRLTLSVLTNIPASDGDIANLISLTH